MHSRFTMKRSIQIHIIFSTKNDVFIKKYESDSGQLSINLYGNLPAKKKFYVLTLQLK